MVATAARAAFVKEEFRHVVSTTAATKTRHGSLARESDVPVETFFDNVADAQAVADARQALLSPDRRRFRLIVVGLSEVMALGYTGAIPAGRYVDTNRGANTKILVTEFMLDFEKQQAALAVWG